MAGTIIQFPQGRAQRQPYRDMEGDADIIQFPVRRPKIVVLYPGGIDDLPYENVQRKPDEN